MSTTTAFQRAFFQLVHSIDYKWLSVLVVCSYFILAITAILYKKAWGADNTVDTSIGMTLQYLELSERSCDNYIALHKRYRKLTNRNYEKYMDLQTKYFHLATKNEELVEKYGQVVDAYKELAGAHSRIAEINEGMVQTYGRFSREYGLISVNLGYALRGYAQPNGT